MRPCTQYGVPVAGRRSETARRPTGNRWEAAGGGVVGAACEYAAVT